MTPSQVQLVQSSFAAVAPIADAAAGMFYARLFDLDPSLQKLFTSDMSEQRRKLMQMIAAAVNGLDRLDTIVPAVRALGVRHATYGVSDLDYETVGSALLWTLEQGLGPAFTPEVQESWTIAYGVLAETMKAAARAAARESAAAAASA